MNLVQQITTPQCVACGRTRGEHEQPADITGPAGFVFCNPYDRDLDVYRLGPGQVVHVSSLLIELDDANQLAALIDSMRTSAQDTLTALQNAGFKIVRVPGRGPPP